MDRLAKEYVPGHETLCRPRPILCFHGAGVFVDALSDSGLECGGRDRSTMGGTLPVRGDHGFRGNDKNLRRVGTEPHKRLSIPDRCGCDGGHHGKLHDPDSGFFAYRVAGKGLSCKKIILEWIKILSRAAILKQILFSFLVLQR